MTPKKEKRDNFSSQFKCGLKGKNRRNKEEMEKDTDKTHSNSVTDTLIPAEKKIHCNNRKERKTSGNWWS